MLSLCIFVNLCYCNTWYYNPTDDFQGEALIVGYFYNNINDNMK